MIENREEQREALETLVDFNGRLVKNMGILVKELSGERLEDTDAFLKDIIQALNWEIQVVNGTLALLNEDKVRIDKQEFNEKVLALNTAVESQEDEKMVQAFQGLISVFERLGEVAKEVIA